MKIFFLNGITAISAQGGVLWVAKKPGRRGRRTPARGEAAFVLQYVRAMVHLVVIVICWIAGLVGGSAETNWPRYTLRASQVLRLNPPGNMRFEPSGLLQTSDGNLLTIHDGGASLYQIQLSPGKDVADLVRLTNFFTKKQMAQAAPLKNAYYDCEGIAQDSQGRIYICEEANRWILRYDAASNTVERLPIDWTPVKRFFSTDTNASFEGIAIGEGKLYVANERMAAVIIVVDLATLKVIDHFQPAPSTISWLGTHYSDLAWYDGHLFVLCRQHRAILEVDPKTKKTVAEYDYSELENQLGYKKRYPVGIMEGLVVNRDSFWLATDNNGIGRVDAPKDIRPTLVRCSRPQPK